MRRKKRVFVAAGLDLLDMLQGVQQYLLTHPHFQTYICILSVSSVKERRRMMEMIAGVRPDGILLPLLPELQRGLSPWNVPVVNFGDQASIPAPGVMFDQVSMGQMAAEHFLSQGLRHFAFGLKREGYYCQLRLQGFQERLQAEGLACHVLDEELRLAGGSINDRQLSQWLMKLPKPVGVHLGHSYLAVRVVWACQKLGLKVPEDVAVLGGMDRPYIGTVWEPTLSAFDLPRSRLGYEGMKMLDQLIRGKTLPAPRVLLPPNGIIQRQSTDLMATKDREVADAARFIRENAHRPISVKELLRHVPLSRRALERRFEAVLKCTPHDEIVRIHMERAMTLLRQTSLSIAEVASRSGFSSYPSFCATFRQQQHRTPTQFRVAAGKRA